MPVIDSLLKIGDAAKLAGISPRQWYKLSAMGRVPAFIRLNRSVRVRASDVDLWIKLGCPDRATLEAEKATRSGATGAAK